MSLEIITTSLLGLTLVSIIWYAWETRKLRRETVKQTELSLRPCIVLFGSREVGSVYIENIGNGSAINVIIELLETDKFRITFKPFELIRSGQRFTHPDFPLYDIEALSQEGKAILEDRSSKADYIMFPFMLKSGDYSLIVHYKNIENTIYYTRLRVKIKEWRIEVLGTGKAK